MESKETPVADAAGAADGAAGGPPVDAPPSVNIADMFNKRQKLDAMDVMTSIRVVSEVHARLREAHTRTKLGAFFEQPSREAGGNYESGMEGKLDLRGPPQALLDRVEAQDIEAELRRQGEAKRTWYSDAEECADSHSTRVLEALLHNNLKANVYNQQATLTRLQAALTTKAFTNTVEVPLEELIPLANGQLEAPALGTDAAPMQLPATAAPNVKEAALPLKTGYRKELALFRVAYRGKPLAEMLEAKSRRMHPKPTFWAGLGDAAPFGDLTKGTTEVNTAVRDARVLAAQDITWHHKPEVAAWQLQRVADYVSVTMYNGRPVELVLDQCNVYPPGGHFAPHQDTPRKDTIGTLVIVLGMPGYGGNWNHIPEGAGLQIHGAQPRAFEMTPRESSGTSRTVTVRKGIVAFYGDVKHEVLPCKFVRASLTFRIVPAKQSETPVMRPRTFEALSADILRRIQEFHQYGAAMRNARARAFLEALRKVRETAAFTEAAAQKAGIPKSHRLRGIGALLSEKYAVHELRALASPFRNDDATIGRVVELLGAEAQYQDLGVRVRIVPVLVDYHRRGEYDESMSTRWSEVFLLDDAEFDALWQQAYKKVTGNGVSKTLEDPETDGLFAFVEPHSIHPDSIVHEVEQEGAEWTGNHAEPDIYHCVYHNAAVLFEFVSREE
jgi:hypothetical protein